MIHLCIPLLALLCTYTHAIDYQTQSSLVAITHKLPSADADWLVVGAGPAGISAIGILLDVGVQPESITWIDPEFNVGRMGIYYGNVPANNKFKDFVIFLDSCKEFQACTQEIEHIKQQNQEDHPFLGDMINVLQALTKHLRTRVRTIEGAMIGLHFDHGLWHIATNHSGIVTAQHVILATGSHPKEMAYEKQKVISLDQAIDREKLKYLVSPNDIVGVVGGAHSAILILKFLSEMNVHHIYNFYRSPITYSLDRGEWIKTAAACFNKTIGLYGIAAQWAQEVLEKNPPANITRIKLDNKDVLETMLPLCTKVIYAIGYEQNSLPAINGTQPITATTAGYIAPRLFGIGIAFPEPMPDFDQTGHYCVGLRCFMRYIVAMVPQWVHSDEFKHVQAVQKQVNALDAFSNLFAIHAL